MVYDMQIFTKLKKKYFNFKNTLSLKKKLSMN